MASVILSSVGASVGLGGFSKLAGSFLGNAIDNKLFGSNNNFQTYGARLRDLSIQSSSYGNMIPIVYGTVKTAGNIIWAKELKEKATNQTVSTKTKGGKINKNHTEYTYYASLAISICEGEITDILRIWADDKLLDLSLYNIRIYKGSNNQLPDPLIEAYQGSENTPAYRGQAYVVFEDFPLADFNNHLPNFNFEIKRNLRSNSENNVEDKINSVVMIPGGGEFVYDTVLQTKINGINYKTGFAQNGKNIPLNQHTAFGKTNALVSLDQLEQTLPNNKWIAVVVNWFATSLDISTCKILPGVEYNNGATTSPDVWKVGKYTRDTARLVSRTNSRPNYGGTINDASLVRYLKELKERGYKVMLYPMLFTDLENKPWRGKITGSIDSIPQFFESNGYNEFITHYATLTKDYVDAFLIGSELIGLTKVMDEENNFPAVDSLIDLASETKKILNTNTKVSYAADWTEYHHTSGGWYNLDKLWASEYIDFIGIDAYFPLTNSNHSVYQTEEIMRGWESGEGYDFYYEDSHKTIKKKLSQEYAWKNIEWWWNNKHINPNGNASNWVPKSKEIWFTEYGFPSVECCTNQPNVFFDSTSIESNYPIHSNGNVDYKAQRAAILATELFWENSEIVTNKFLWSWDARPYPYWPDDLHIWSDGSSYQKGHWVQGKFGVSMLSDIINDISLKASGSLSNKITSELTDHVEGVLIDNKQSARKTIELLKNVYFFDIVERDSHLYFEKRASKKINLIDNTFLIKDGESEIQISKIETNDIPTSVDINFLNSSKNYTVSNVHSILDEQKNEQSSLCNLPIVMSEAYAQVVADVTLNELWQQQNTFNFSLPPKFSYLTVGDVIQITFHNKIYTLRITSIHLGTNLISKITAITENLSIYKNIRSEESKSIQTIQPLSKTKLEVLDIPYITKPDQESEINIYLAACGYGENWDGAKIFISEDNGNIYNEVCEASQSATMGNATSFLGYYETDQIDYKNKFTVTLMNGSLEKISDDLFISGYNKAIVGDEIIFFKNAKLIAENTYEISELIRGMYGTEKHIGSHVCGDRFVLINDDLVKVNIPYENISKHFNIKAVTFKDSLGNTDSQLFHMIGNSLKTFSITDVNVSGNKIIWTRRSRIPNFLTNFKDAPLGENFEKYIVEIYNSSDELIDSIEVGSSELTIENCDIAKANVQQVSSYIF